MTRDDIIRMALEASAIGDASELTGDAIERFAALVAAAERGAIVALGTDTASDWISLGGRDEAAAVSSFVADICKRSAT